MRTQWISENWIGYQYAPERLPTSVLIYAQVIYYPFESTF